MRVLQVDEARALALCEDGGGARSTVEIALVDAGPGDQAVPMVVEQLDAASGLATCVDSDGARAEVDVTLVDAAVGATVLVHAGTAIA